jgi:hypothetical protein
MTSLHGGNTVHVSSAQVLTYTGVFQSHEKLIPEFAASLGLGNHVGRFLVTLFEVHSACDAYQNETNFISYLHHSATWLLYRQSHCEPHRLQVSTP